MNIEQLKQKITQRDSNAVVAVANAVDPSIFRAADAAIKDSMADFQFIGPLDEMASAMEEASFSADEDHCTFIDCESEKEAAEIAVKLVSQGKSDVLMKGMIPTSTLLKAVLHKEYGLRSGKILSHLAGFQIEGREKLLFLTDSAMNIAPDLKEKVQIVDNAVYAISQMGFEDIKVAVLAAIETVNPAMQATLDGAVLTQMNRRGQIANCTVEGPLGLDNAISAKAAKQKKIDSPVAGAADILVVPQIETGNILYKSFTYVGGATVGGMIIGARAPIILTSRTDSEESKLFSLAMAISAI